MLKTQPPAYGVYFQCDLFSSEPLTKPPPVYSLAVVYVLPHTYTRLSPYLTPPNNISAVSPTLSYPFYPFYGLQRTFFFFSRRLKDVEFLAFFILLIIF